MRPCGRSTSTFLTQVNASSLLQRRAFSLRGCGSAGCEEKGSPEVTRSHITLPSLFLLALAHKEALFSQCPPSSFQFPGTDRAECTGRTEPSPWGLGSRAGSLWDS